MAKIFVYSSMARHHTLVWKYDWNWFFAKLKWILKCLFRQFHDEFTPKCNSNAKALLKDPNHIFSNLFFSRNMSQKYTLPRNGNCLKIARIPREQPSKMSIEQNENHPYRPRAQSTDVWYRVNSFYLYIKKGNIICVGYYMAKGVQSSISIYPYPYPHQHHHITFSLYI